MNKKEGERRGMEEGQRNTANEEEWRRGRGSLRKEGERNKKEKEKRR